jgi:hypothetical protein
MTGQQSTVKRLVPSLPSFPLELHEPVTVFSVSSVTAEPEGCSRSEVPACPGHIARRYFFSIVWLIACSSSAIGKGGNT